MNKFALSSIVSGFVLSSGLVSCSKEIKTQDVYLAPPPKIIRATESADIVAWDQRPVKELDLQDALDVSAGRPTKIKIESDCSFNGKHILTHFYQENPSRIYFHQLMPERIFIQEKINHDCSFTLQLFNATGSSRIFKTRGSQIVESRIPNVTLESETPGPAGVRLRYIPRTKQYFRARYDNRAASQARVLCPDLTTRALAFDNVIDLSNFDYKKDQEEQYRRRVQTCRVVILQNGITVGFSPQFTIEPYDMQPLKIDVIRNYKTGELTKQEAFTTFSRLLDNRKVALDEVHLTNPSPYQRWVKLVDNRQAVTAILTLNNAHGGQRPTLSFLKNGLTLEPMREVYDWGYFVIDPGETLKLKLVLNTQPLTCNGAPVSLSLKPSRSFVFQDLNENKEVLTTSAVIIPEMHWSQNLAPIFGPAVEPFCKWPDLGP